MSIQTDIFPTLTPASHVHIFTPANCTGLNFTPSSELPAELLTNFINFQPITPVQAHGLFIDASSIRIWPDESLLLVVAHKEHHTETVQNASSEEYTWLSHLLSPGARLFLLHTLPTNRPPNSRYLEESMALD